MMPPSRVLGFHGLCVSTRSARALFVWMLPIGGCVSSPGFMRRMARYRGHPLEPQAPEEPLLFAAYAGPGRSWANVVALNAFLVVPFCFFTRPRPPLSGWSTMIRQVALTYTATILVALAAQQAGRPDLIRSPKRVLAHTWEGF